MYKTTDDIDRENAPFKSGRSSFKREQSMQLYSAGSLTGARFGASNPGTKRSTRIDPHQSQNLIQNLRTARVNVPLQTTPRAGTTAQSRPSKLPGATTTSRRTLTTEPPAPRRRPSQGVLSPTNHYRLMSMQPNHQDPSAFSAPRGSSPHPRALSPSHPYRIPSHITAANMPTHKKFTSSSGMGESNTHEKQNASSQTRANAAKRKPKHKPTSEGLTVVESKRVGATATLEKLQGELEKVNLTNNESNDVLHALIQESRRRKRVACLTLTKYNVLRIVARNLGFTPEYSTEVLQQSRFFMCWSDTVLKLEQLVKFFNWQRSNHFPSMYLLCRKGHLGATIAKLRSLEPSHYRFYPRSWLMRKQKEAFRKVLNSKEDGNKYFIMKPNAGCQGRGIMLTKDPFTAGRELDNYIVQEYIRNPLLIEGKKFDLRVYVLLTSIRDPSIFIFEDGLVRICADPYDPPNESNIRNTCKHLTNYAVNKKNPNFVFNEDAEQGDVGNKRNFKFFNNWLKANGHDSQAFWKSVGDVVTKTILAAQPQLANVYNTCFPIANEGYTCFEVLGFDILVDSKLKPWLIEVNHTPSFATETPLDLDIKSRLLEEVWNIVDVTPAVLETDALREQNEFTRRSLPPWAKNHPIYSQYLAANPITPTPRRDPLVINPGLPSPSSTTPTLGNPLEVPSFVQDRREQENKKLRGFTRVYPSNDPFLDSIYQQIRLSALRAWSTKPVELKEVAPTTVVKKEPSPPSEAASSAPSPVAPAPEVEKSEEPKSSIPSDEGILAETDPRSMSRPKPTEEELLWLQNLQKKLDELSESDPKRSELETHRDE